MAVKVRLTRVGNRNNPIWRVVVADDRAPRDGRFIEVLGHYNPQRSPSEIRIDEERLERWLSRGAQPTRAVSKLVAALRRGHPPAAELRAEAERQQKARAATAASEVAESSAGPEANEADSQADSESTANAQPTAETEPTAEGTAGDEASEGSAEQPPPEAKEPAADAGDDGAT
ncbi:30S ribosomal protein S16 [Thermoleophilum album]|uniref:Small ribosomal subunit protein bS16 n=1 Tax=Thermoleophilum album TaxID=29539 RepID=A0A1H6FY76_THEAL|nr:30S ribosomal protein S16 [Thermoleophilum album]SEH15138.1 small subunit ribosomal protein S16 [Thermoleophilum album]